ncbi:hypothetical protein AYR62_05555 [Secundilactobacillus paracollinoides]|uniref:Nitroreductase domain-containing protein n=1 Tax=Secundilactobacillus paracollinoides TaxID=240427 RepID=A0A1B2J0N8_9LACO|nr:nitroreductase [Secundilactobacillus paracollinoides]ANZ63611.1 hypothetical protein AYR62_05555 [Secundilactobacillus paracollinoides]ANZ67871.1 hypothetical protein AYR63_12465 [Secundilactobacillus paracollinoides]KRL79281.1 p-nitrobenzoate reductase [Secundilactobacillus paracollinoides DSM 15502 = JCM 11969]
MDAKEAIINRKAIRQFTDQSIDHQTIVDLLKTAQKAPSWVNAQAGHIYVASGATLEKIRAVHKEAVVNQEKGASDLPVMARTKWPQYSQDNMAEWTQGIAELLGDSWGETFQQAEEALYGAQAVVYLTLPKGYSNWALYDLGAFGEALMVAATAAGLGSMPAYQYIKFPQELRQHLPIPDSEDIIIGIGLGYVNDEAPINQIKAARMPLDEIVTYKD